MATDLNDVNEILFVFKLHFYFRFIYKILLIAAPMPMESVLPPPVPFQLLRDPASGQFLFFPTAVPTAATSIGMYFVIILYILRNQH